MAESKRWYYEGPLVYEGVGSARPIATMVSEDHARRAVEAVNRQVDAPPPRVFFDLQTRDGRSYVHVFFVVPALELGYAEREDPQEAFEDAKAEAQATVQGWIGKNVDGRFVAQARAHIESEALSILAEIDRLERRPGRRPDAGAHVAQGSADVGTFGPG